MMHPKHAIQEWLKREPGNRQELERCMNEAAAVTGGDDDHVVCIGSSRDLEFIHNGFATFQDTIPANRSSEVIANIRSNWESMDTRGRCMLVMSLSLVTTQTMVAEVLGISQQRVSHYYASEYNPKGIVTE